MATLHSILCAPNVIPCLLRTRMSGLFFVARLTPFGLRAPKNDRSPRSALLQQGAAGGAAFVFSTRPPGMRRKNKSCDDRPLDEMLEVAWLGGFQGAIYKPCNRTTEQPTPLVYVTGLTVFWFSANFGETEYRSAASFADSSSNAKKMALFFLALIHQMPYSECSSATMNF